MAHQCAYSKCRETTKEHLVCVGPVHTHKCHFHTYYKKLSNKLGNRNTLNKDTLRAIRTRMTQETRAVWNETAAAHGGIHPMMREATWPFLLPTPVVVTPSEVGGGGPDERADKDQVKGTGADDEDDHQAEGEDTATVVADLDEEEDDDDDDDDDDDEGADADADEEDVDDEEWVEVDDGDENEEWVDDDDDDDDRQAPTTTTSWCTTQRSTRHTVLEMVTHVTDYLQDPMEQNTNTETQVLEWIKLCRKYATFVCEQTLDSKCSLMDLLKRTWIQAYLKTGKPTYKSKQSSRQPAGGATLAVSRHEAAEMVRLLKKLYALKKSLSTKTTTTRSLQNMAKTANHNKAKATRTLDHWTNQVPELIAKGEWGPSKQIIPQAARGLAADFMNQYLPLVRRLNQGDQKAPTFNTADGHVLAGTVPIMSQLLGCCKRDKQLSALRAWECVQWEKADATQGWMRTEAKESCQGLVTVMPAPRALTILLPLYRQEIRPFLTRNMLRQGHAHTKPVDPDDLEHTHSIVSLPATKYELLLLQKNLGAKGTTRKGRMWRLIFYSLGPPGGWKTTDLTEDWLHNAYNMSSYNTALFLTARGDPMTDFGLPMRRIFKKYTGLRIGTTRLRDILTTEAAAVAHEDPERMKATDFMLQHTKTTSLKHYRHKNAMAMAQKWSESYHMPDGDQLFASLSRKRKLEEDEEEEEKDQEADSEETESELTE
jgi:hypothetical protein